MFNGRPPGRPLCYNQRMATVTIRKDEYQALKRQSAAYKKLASKLFEAVVKDDIGAVVRDFSATGKYSATFLAEFESGLRKSSYARA